MKVLDLYPIAAEHALPKEAPFRSIPSRTASRPTPRGVRADDGGLTVSSIYKWYQKDFGGNWQGVLAHRRRYANPATAQMLAPFSTIHADTYDWQLNDAATGAKTMQEPERK